MNKHTHQQEAQNSSPPSSDQTRDSNNSAKSHRLGVGVSCIASHCIGVNKYDDPVKQ